VPHHRRYREDLPTAVIQDARHACQVNHPRVESRIGCRPCLSISIVTSAEVVALASLHPDHLTLASGVLDQLAAEPAPQNPSEAPDEPKPHHPHLSAPRAASAAPSETSGVPNSNRLSVPSAILTISWLAPAPESTDFLANGAEALREALAADSESSRKLADALKIFGEMEFKTQALIREQLASIQ
jgi:transaldolase